MASRLALILVLVLALSGTFIVEQPGSSLLWRHPRLQWVCGLVKVGRALCESCCILNQACSLLMDILLIHIVLTCQGFQMQLLDDVFQLEVTKANFFVE